MLTAILHITPLKGADREILLPLNVAKLQIYPFLLFMLSYANENLAEVLYFPNMWNWNSRIKGAMCSWLLSLILRLSNTEVVDTWWTERPKTSLCDEPGITLLINMKWARKYIFSYSVVKLQPFPSPFFFLVIFMNDYTQLCKYCLCFSFIFLPSDCLSSFTDQVPFPSVSLFCSTLL